MSPRSASAPGHLRIHHRFVRPVLAAACLLLAVAGRAAAQAGAVAEELAPVLAAEDARDFQPGLFARSVTAADPLVRQTAAMAIGRIGDLRGTPLLVRLLVDPDSMVQTDAVFALGLLRDTAAVGPLLERLSTPPGLAPTAIPEAVAALARIGGPRAADWIGSVLYGRAQLVVPDTGAVVREAVLQAWRLRGRAPVAALVPFLTDTASGMRWRAAYTLGTLRAPEAASQLAALMSDPVAPIRAIAARALTRAYADSSGTAAGTFASLLANRTDDDDPQVRINAMRTLGTYHDSAYAAQVAGRVDDAFPQARLQAVMTLGDLGGHAASEALRQVLAGHDPVGVRAEALVALARVDPAAFEEAAPAWRTATDWRMRAAAARGWAVLRSAGAAPFFLNDPDGRVTAAGLQAWSDALPGPEPALLGAARRLLANRDAAVRSVAADIVSRAADPSDVAALSGAYRRAGADSIPDAALSALGALAAIARHGEAGRLAVDQGFLAGAARPEDYLLRAWADRNWPVAARRWGPAYPIATGRTAQDYRDLARTYLMAPAPGYLPHVFIETERRGTIELELFGADAPLTVANFLRLVDRRFFDGNQWHRVVPNFVVQDGDPRGDGWGGPGGAIRDEINRRRYDAPVIGMALSGPNTGASQWFINLSAQPHLDGIYTVFGRVVAGQATLTRILPGDLIRSIHR